MLEINELPCLNKILVELEEKFECKLLAICEKIIEWN